ncbi:excisionase family DNA binding protein [Bacillus mesophilus]|uniref:Excisionase family DNA-binding protein n=1 Tax=Bacillus mesophilus TaxID=1808955 RepID=A0A6M0QDQ3_9BACI|nr:excisionase family DNA-binding protein [Bacillus mesophilus]MBM7662680.1 excisionase family DNA binding protein [Bacillus mesophilus]NEY73258.1 excisionase family DNA-binding protein [Bacillus mesophilus]
MYLSIKETAEYLAVKESEIVKLINQRKIKYIHDGEGFLINKDQFDTHLKQVEKYKGIVEDFLREPVPEDVDIKDED